MTSAYDVAVIGAGLIGASAASQLAAHCKVALLEQEAQPGYHSSGRSAAVLIPYYGGPLARALTRASVGFLSDPPHGFSDVPLTAARGAIFLAGHGQESLLEQWRPERSAPAGTVHPLTAAEAAQHVPILNMEQISAAMLLSDIKDIDAAALLQGYVKAFRSRGGTLRLGAPVTALKHESGTWIVETTSGPVRAKTLVNAAGAWADHVADLAGVPRLAMAPTRRTMVIVDGPAGIDVRRWPLVSDAAETFYFKPDGARLIVCPADQSPVAAQDIQPEEWDVAVAVDRMESATSLRIQRVEHKWAGLRTFAPDKEPVIGLDHRAPGFFWAAGFGGYGVQAAPAAGWCCEALICGSSQVDLPDIDLDRLSPRRFL